MKQELQYFHYLKKSCIIWRQKEIFYQIICKYTAAFNNANTGKMLWSKRKDINILLWSLQVHTKIKSNGSWRPLFSWRYFELSRHFELKNKTTISFPNLIWLHYWARDLTCISPIFKWVFWCQSRHFLSWTMLNLNQVYSHGIEQR